MVVVAHGSTRNADSGRPAWEQVAELRRRGIFAEVTEAFWKQEPQVTGVLRGLFSRRVFVVPLFVADGWFTRQVIPRALGLRGAGEADFPAVQRRGGQTLYYTRAVGSHPGMTDVLLARAGEVVRRHPFPRVPRREDTAMVVVGHGTSYSRGSREAIEAQVERLRLGGGYAEVVAVFLEEAPRVRDCFALTTARNVVMVPFFISDGLHIQEDLPVELGESAAEVRERLMGGRPTWRNPTERNGRRIWCASAVGHDPLMAEVLIERAREVAGVGVGVGGEGTSSPVG